MTTVSRVVGDVPQEPPSNLRAENCHRIHRREERGWSIQAKGKLYLIIRHGNLSAEFKPQFRQPETSDCFEFRTESEALSYEKKHRASMALELVATPNGAK